MKQEIIRAAKIELSRRSFWKFCQTLAPGFYLDSRPHLKTICEALQALYEGRIQKHNVDDDWQIVQKINPEWITCKKLMLNVPPQHGKSRTLINFSNWIFGKNPSEKIITCSYNDSVASDFSKYTRNGISEPSNDGSLVYSDIFPDTRIKRGTSSFEKWALEGQHFSYLGAGIGGSVTSKGGTILMVDDPVKSAEDALNENNLDRIWLWYTSTFLSRVSAEKGEPIEIICMTRWSKNDICGKILDGDSAGDWYQIKMEAYDKNTGQMLCNDLFGFKRYGDMEKTVHEGIFQANYHQKAIEVEGILFKESLLNRFRASDLTDDGLETILGYCDTKDEGIDFLSFPFAKIYKGRVFIVDVIFTQDTVDVTMPQSAAKITELKVDYVRVEKNNQGMGFIRDLRTRVPEEKVLQVHNTKSKLSRIWNEYAFIMKYCYFLDKRDIVPGSQYEKFLKNLCAYMKDGSSKVDDAPDSVAGLARFIQAYEATNILFQ